MHQPLSQSLTQMLQTKGDDKGAVTFNQLLAGTDGRGLFLVVILLCLPFITPITIPGVSTVLGPIIGLLAWRLALGRPPHLPAKFGARAMPDNLRKILLGGGVKFLRFIERGVKPRRTFWMSWRVTRLANALLMVFMALLLTLPLPPIPPLTNTLPSYAIILVAASMMEEDGVMIWLGYALAVGTVVYFAFWAELITKHLARLMQGLGHWLSLST